MRRIVVVGLFTLVSALSPILSQAVINPVCDVECAPDRGGAGYGNLIGARTRPQNARGGSTKTVTMLASGGRVKNTVGSQSYNFPVPILHLPGRNGLDVNLTLTYNSRVWTLDPAAGQVTFNLDRDWPSYGFRLGFGDIEWEPSTNVMTVTEADSTKHKMVQVGTVYVSTDSTYMQYAPPVLTYKNGMKVTYELFPSAAASGDNKSEPERCWCRREHWRTVHRRQHSCADQRDDFRQRTGRQRFLWTCWRRLDPR